MLKNEEKLAFSLLGVICFIYLFGNKSKYFDNTKNVSRCMKSNYLADQVPMLLLPELPDQPINQRYKPPIRYTLPGLQQLPSSPFSRQPLEQPQLYAHPDIE